MKTYNLRIDLWQIFLVMVVLLVATFYGVKPAVAYQGFIGDAVGPAQASQAETGVPASVTIAQAIIESGWGDKHIGSANNYFGIKCQRNGTYFGKIATGCVLADTQEWDGSKYVWTKAYFRTYASMTDSFRDHGYFFIENSRYAEAMKHTDDPDRFAREIHKAGYATGPTYADDLINLMKKYNLYQYNTTTTPNTSTVLVLDTSGSMGELDASGMVKLQAAQSAGGDILDIIAAENQAVSSWVHQVAIVNFSDYVQVDAPMGTDLSAAKAALWGLYPGAGTGMPAGLKTAIDQFSGSTGGGKPIIILLSDGMPNIGLNGESDESVVRQQVLDLASQAGQQGICIYTVGFGDPSASGDAGLDEAFLEQLARDSGCGSYHNARDAWQLANVYIALRHASTGNTLLEKSGQIAQDQVVDVGKVQIPDNQSMILFTLNWPGSRLDPILMDPVGHAVDNNYPGASISNTNTLASIIIQDPQSGQWQVSARGVDVPEGVTNYNAVLSIRPKPVAPPTVKPSVPPSSTAFPMVILILLLAGGGVVVYVITHTTGRPRATVAATVSGQGRLMVLSGGKAGQVVPLADGLLIGRASSCSLHLDDRAVSRQHARLRFSQGRWYIQDMGSTGGTYVNSIRTSAGVLNNGDRIRIGSTEFEFRI